jgi:cytochrome c-type biogenesis protein CcmH/NrfG
MSYADLPGYNYFVLKFNNIVRGFLTIITIVLLILLMSASNWLPFNRLISRAQTAIESGNYLTASFSLAQAADYSNDKSELLERAGQFAFQAGDIITAQYYLRQVFASQELSRDGLKLLGDIARQNGKLDEASDYWEAANAIQEDRETHIKLVEVYRQSSDWENAISYQRKLVALAPNDAKNAYQLGLMLAATEPETALAYLSLAGELDASLKPNTNRLVRNLSSAINRSDESYPFMVAGQELAALDEWELALQAFSNAVELVPDSSDAWAYLGEARYQLGGDGYKDLENAVELDPGSIAVNTLLALHWQRQERYDLALVNLYAAAEADRDNPALQAEIGNTLAILGNLPAAEVHYRLATSMDPKNTTYWNSLANFYIRYEIEIKDKAAAAARQAVVLDPDDPDSLDILAQVYLLQDQPLLARRFLARALNADQEHAPAHLHSGLVDILEGNRLAAYQHFSKALALSSPGSPINDQAQRLLNTYFP